MYRITLTDQQRHELRQRTRQAGIAPSTRDRLEMVRRSDAGWSVPTMACPLGQHEQTVRAWIKAFLAGGFDALPNKPRGGDTSDLTSAMLEAAHTEVAKRPQGWRAKQIAAWIAEHEGVRLSPGRMRVHLARANCSYHRTARSLKHQQQPAEVAKRQEQLEVLEKQRMPG